MYNIKCIKITLICINNKCMALKIKIYNKFSYTFQEHCHKFLKTNYLIYYLI